MHMIHAHEDALKSYLTVIEEIDNVAGSGAVKVAGKVWTARSADGDVIPAGTKAEALRIEGVKLIVKPIHEQVIVEE